MMMSRNNTELRQFINDTFSDDELETFCFDYFPDVSSEIGGGLGLNRKTIILIRHCQNRGLQDDLEAALARERPGLWNERFGKSPLKTVDIPNLVSLFDLLGLKRVEEWEILKKWQDSDLITSLVVPIGVDVDGNKVLLDLNESGYTNGMVAGASGSGKTRFLECLIAMLAASYHPHTLNFMLIDFKGSSFLQVLPDLPHCISVIGSIEDKSKEEQRWYLARVLKALTAEILQRKRLFDKMKVGNISKYRQLRLVDSSLEPVPQLVIVVDETAELATEEAGFFLDGLVGMARTTRGLGIHLILATQQPATINYRIRSICDFRVSFRFNKIEDSNAILERPEAAYIEQRGRGYLQTRGNNVFELFQGPYGGSPYEETDPTQLKVNQQKQTQLKALVQYIRHETDRAGVQSMPDLLPRTLDHLVALEDLPSDGGWNGSGWEFTKHWLKPVIGVQDDPMPQTMGLPRKIPLLRANLARFGHLFVSCGNVENTKLPLRTLITSLARTHSPKELNIYVLDFGNYTLNIFKGLPHIGDGGIIPASNRQRIARLFHWLSIELMERQKLLTNLEMSWTEAREQGEDLERPAIVLVINNLAKQAVETSWYDELHTLLDEGASNGIYVVLATGPQIPFLRTYRIGSHLALGFTNQMAFKEVIEAMPRDQTVLAGLPDRGIYYDLENGVVECHIVTPAIGGEQGLSELIGKMKAAAEQANMPAPFPIKELNHNLPLRSIMPGDILSAWKNPIKMRMPIGDDDLALDPCTIDLLEDGPHFLILGPPSGGKTVALQTWLLSLAAHVSPLAMRLVLFDNLYHTLDPLRGLPQVWQSVSTEEEAITLLKQLKDQLERYSEPVLTPSVVLAIDDLDQMRSTRIRSELARLSIIGARRGLYVLASCRTADLMRYEELERALLRYKSVLFVGSTDIKADAALFDIGLRREHIKERMPPGRGCLVRRGEYRMVQIATPGNSNDVRDWAKRIARTRDNWAAESRNHND